MYFMWCLISKFSSSGNVNFGKNKLLSGTVCAFLDKEYQKAHVWMYLLTEDRFNGVLHLCRIIYVDGPDVRPSDVHLSIGVLGGQLGVKGQTDVKHDRWRTAKMRNEEEWSTSLSVGLPLKKSVFLLLLDGSNLGFRKAQPLAMASRGAGPSYGKESPTKSWRRNRSLVI